MKFFIFAFNNPLYLQYQVKCLRKFVQEPFELCCIDNAKILKYSNQLKSICSANNIHHIKNLAPDHSEAGKSHYSALRWSWDSIISDTEETVVMMDHDIFPIEHVSITELLDGASMAGPSQSRGTPDNCVEYFHPSLMIFDTKTLPNKKSISFRGSMINGYPTDTGGDLHHYFQNNPNVKKTFLQSRQLAANDPFFDPKLIAKYGRHQFIKYGRLQFTTLMEHIFEMVGGKFLHTRNGSNWDNWDNIFMENRNRLIFDILRWTD